MKYGVQLLSMDYYVSGKERVCDGWFGTKLGGLRPVVPNRTARFTAWESAARLKITGCSGRQIVGIEFPGRPPRRRWCDGTPSRGRNGFSLGTGR